MKNYEGGGMSLSRRELLAAGLTTIASLALAACGAKRQNRAPQAPRPTPSATVPNRLPSPERYPWHAVVATIFWIGEGASADNGDISNTSTEWDDYAVKHFGGIDDPNNRDSRGLPRGFTPRQNPCYVALPASEFNDNGLIPGVRDKAPWPNTVGNSEDRSDFKGRWVEVRCGERVAYGQWADTGPSDNPDGTYDYGYVFGTKPPSNQFGLQAGIDISPTMSELLGFSVEEGSANVSWRFVGQQDVPPGVWTQYAPFDNTTDWS